MKSFKGWRTIAINVLTFIGAVVAWEDITKYLDPQHVVILAALVNMGLRWVTTTAVGQASASTPSASEPVVKGAILLMLLPFAMGLASCSGLPKVSQVAPLVCAYATSAEAEQAAVALVQLLPDGPKKDKARLALPIAAVSADAACVYLKILEAAQAQSQGNPAQ